MTIFLVDAKRRESRCDAWILGMRASGIGECFSPTRAGRLHAGRGRAGAEIRAQGHLHMDRT